MCPLLCAQRVLCFAYLRSHVDASSRDIPQVAIQERDRPLVIDFFATWCGPCVLLASELEKVRGLSEQLPFGNTNGASLLLSGGLFCFLTFGSSRFPQVAETLGDKVRIVKVDTDAEPTLASQLQVSSRPSCSDCVVKSSCLVPPHATSHKLNTSVWMAHHRSRVYRRWYLSAWTRPSQLFAQRACCLRRESSTSSTTYEWTRGQASAET